MNIVSRTKINAFLSMIKPVNIQEHLVRIGGDNDGGYLLPDDIKDIDACLSPGVGPVITFDVELANAGIPVFTCDASVEALPVNSDKIHFDKLFLSDQTGGNNICINEWINSKIAQLDKSDNLILEMDIEGAEYKCLNALSNDLLKQFKIMTIEFHTLAKWWQKSSYDHYYDLFKKLTKYHSVVHIHPNTACGVHKLNSFSSPDVIEITFYRKNSRIKPVCKDVLLPHPLDMCNIPGENIAIQKERSVLPKYWYLKNIEY